MEETWGNRWKKKSVNRPLDLSWSLGVCMNNELMYECMKNEFLLLESSLVSERLHYERERLSSFIWMYYPISPDCWTPWRTHWWWTWSSYTTTQPSSVAQDSTSGLAFSSKTPLLCSRMLGRMAHNPPFVTMFHYFLPELREPILCFNLRFSCILTLYIHTQIILHF